MLIKVFDISDNSIDQEDQVDQDESTDQEDQVDQEESTDQEDLVDQEESTDQEDQVDHEESTDLVDQVDQEESTDQEDQVDYDSSFDSYYFYSVSENTISGNFVTSEQLAYFDTTVIFLLACVLGALVFNAFMKKL